MRFDVEPAFGYRDSLSTLRKSKGSFMFILLPVLGEIMTRPFLDGSGSFRFLSV